VYKEGLVGRGRKCTFRKRGRGGSGNELKGRKSGHLGRGRLGSLFGDYDRIGLFLARKDPLPI
jgi:hypothetical protein